MASDFFGGRSEDSVEEYTYSEAFALAEEVIENWDDYANAIVVAASNYYTKYEGSPPRIKETDLENPYNFQIELNFVEALRVTSVKYKADVADSYGKYESCEDTGGSSNCWQLDYYTDVPPTPYVLVANEGYYRIKYVISEYNDLSDDLEDYGTSFLNAYLGVSQQEGNYILTDDTADEIPGDLQIEVTATTKSESVTQSNPANFTVPDDLEISIDSNYSSFGNVFYSFLQYQYSATAGEQFNLEQGTVEDNTGENVSPGPSL
tara:strand:+ start:91 stop:879 length:789 start_codon:yes stop_codon:yes gene_type:complete